MHAITAGHEPDKLCVCGIAYKGTACLQKVMLDSIHNNLLHLAKAHEGDQVSQSRDLHHAIHVAQLLQQAQHSHPLQGLAVLLQGHLIYWAGACKRADSPSQQ